MELPPKNKQRTSHNEGSVVIQFNLAGLITFTISLVLVVGLLSYGLAHARTREGAGGKGVNGPFASVDPDIPPKDTPLWGELHSVSIELEPPEEYLAFDVQKEWTPAWVFEGMSPDKVRETMNACGLSHEQIEQALTPQNVSTNGSGTSIQPPDALVLSLPAQTRSKLYATLSHTSANQFIRFPFCYFGAGFDDSFKDAGVSAETLATMKKLLYQRGDVTCFSDYELMMREIKSDSERLNWVKALSRQSAVLTRLRVRPDTDVDKLLGYWNRGIQVSEARALLESLRRASNGGSISLLYLLPPFARQRLYTFPSSTKASDPTVDCHWSTMNFFNETPDDRFSNPAYTGAFIRDNFYEVAKPTLYGDVILFLDDHNVAVHSAVYLADDLVFTKNGNNFAQPWMIMHLKDLSAKYATGGARLAVFRNKNRS